MISSLGFDERHVIYTFIETSPDVLLVVTPSRTSEQGEEAYRRLTSFIDFLRTAKGLGVRVERVGVDASSPWRCVEEIADKLAEIGPGEIYVDVGGGVRSIVVCLTLLATALAVDNQLVTRLKALYTWAENVNRPVKASLAPLHFYKSLHDARASTKRRILSQLSQSGELDIRGDKYAREVARQLSEHEVAEYDEERDVVRAGEPARALEKLLRLRERLTR